MARDRIVTVHRPLSPMIPLPRRIAHSHLTRPFSPLATQISRRPRAEVSRSSRPTATASADLAHRGGAGNSAVFANCNRNNASSCSNLQSGRRGRSDEADPAGRCACTQQFSKERSTSWSSPTKRRGMPLTHALVTRRRSYGRPRTLRASRPTDDVIQAASGFPRPVQMRDGEGRSTQTPSIAADKVFLGCTWLRVMGGCVASIASHRKAPGYVEVRCSS